MDPKNETRQHKCRTCFGMVQGTPVRCPHCGAFQDWRRRITIANLLGWAMLLLLVILATYGISVWHAFNKHSSDVRAAMSFQSTDQITARIDLTNAGDRPAIVVSLGVEFTNKRGDRITVYASDGTQPEELNVPAQGMIFKRVAIANCPDSISMPVAHLYVRNFNGTMQHIDVPLEMSLSCTGPRVKPPSAK